MSSLQHKLKGCENTSLMLSQDFGHRAESGILPHHPKAQVGRACVCIFQPAHHSLYLLGCLGYQGAHCSFA